MHGRLLRLSARDLAQMQYSHKRFVMDFYLHFFLVQTLTFELRSKSSISFVCLFDENSFLGFKIGISYPDRDCVGIRPGLRRDSGFSSKIGIIPTKSGWLDTLQLHTAVYIVRKSYRTGTVC